MLHVESKELSVLDSSEDSILATKVNGTSVVQAAFLSGGWEKTWNTEFTKCQVREDQRTSNVAPSAALCPH